MLTKVAEVREIKFMPYRPEYIIFIQKNFGNAFFKFTLNFQNANDQLIILRMYILNDLIMLGPCMRATCYCSLSDFERIK